MRYFQISSLCISRPQYIQGKDHNSKIQQREHQHNHGKALEYVDVFTYLDSIINEQEGSDADVKTECQSKGHLSTTEEHMEFETTVNQYQNQNLQYERHVSWFYSMELKRGEPLQPSTRMYKYL
ncbi:unnamed protein product [Schistosoma curassoni]|uniref:Ovule protein n=1 Tax=Schistosoma curassoni TaxID=6186 RepID=A0A183JKT8_9TREM|nr:unnamed protein product [Schistosoma curassoni]